MVITVKNLRLLLVISVFLIAAFAPVAVQAQTYRFEVSEYEVRLTSNLMAALRYITTWFFKMTRTLTPLTSLIWDCRKAIMTIKTSLAQLMINPFQR